MKAKTKSIQIQLRESVPQEKLLLDYLEQQGARTGTPKRLLINGFLAEVGDTKISKENEIPAEKEAPVSPFANLAVKG